MSGATQRSLQTLNTWRRLLHYLEAQKKVQKNELSIPQKMILKQTSKGKEAVNLSADSSVQFGASTVSVNVLKYTLLMLFTLQGEFFVIHLSQRHTLKSHKLFS